LYIVNFISIFFDSQIYFILQSKNKSRRAKNVDKTTTNKKEIEKAKKIEIETRETKIEPKITKTNTKTNAKIDTIAVATIATIARNKK